MEVVENCINDHTLFFQQLAAAAIKANMLAAKAVLAEAASGGDEPPAIPCVPKIEGATPAMPGIAPSIIPETPKAAKAAKTPKKAPKSKSKEGAGPSEPKEPPVIPLELREWEETPRTPFKPEIKRKTKKQLALEAAEAAKEAEAEEVVPTEADEALQGDLQGYALDLLETNPSWEKRTVIQVLADGSTFSTLFFHMRHARHGGPKLTQTLIVY